MRNSKKFFGLLTSAALLLNGASISVFAEEMVEASGVVGAVTNADGSIAINSTNFPDDNLLKAVQNAAKAQNVTDAAKIKELSIPSNVEDFSGLQYLTGLTQLTINGNDNIGALNLSTNEDLQNLTVTNSKSLYALTLPKTQSLTTVNISGNTALTSLDLSPATVLGTANINNNGIAQLDLSNNAFLTTLNVNGNKLYSLDTTNCPKLITLNAANNKIYEFKTAAKTIVNLNLSGNKLREFDGTNMSSLETLDLSDNMLETISLPDGNHITSFNCDQNHLASLDLSEAISTEANTFVKTGKQTLFAGQDDTAIDLKAYDKDFDSKQAKIINPTTGNATGESFPTNGVITFPDNNSNGGSGGNGGSGSGEVEKPLVEANQIEVTAELATEPTEEKIEIEFDPMTVAGSSLPTNAEIDVESVKGTADINGERVNLSFEKDESDPTGKKWIATPENSPESKKERSIISFEAGEEAKKWSGVPTNVVVWGVVKVSAPGFAKTLFDFTIGSAASDTFLKVNEPLKAGLSEGTAAPSNPEDEPSENEPSENEPSENEPLTKSGAVNQSMEVKASSVLNSVTPAFAYTYNTEEDNMTVYIYKENIMNRLYNPNSGEHFYTHDTHERDVLVSLGWQAEGVGWVAPKASESSAPVYRLYNANAGDHHYTKDANEKDTLVTLGWTFEGVGWYSATDPEVGNRTIAVFREYNPNAKEAGAHNYTISENENATLVSLGWIDEGIAWNALK